MAWSWIFSIDYSKRNNHFSMLHQKVKSWLVSGMNGPLRTDLFDIPQNWKWTIKKTVHFPHCEWSILSTYVYFSKDQEEIETYVPLLADNTLIAFFLLIYVFALIAIQMPYILVEVMIALIPTYILLKYGWRAIDVMKRMDLESRTPWYQHTLATVTGLSIIRTFKKENEAIDLFYEL